MHCLFVFWYLSVDSVNCLAGLLLLVIATWRVWRSKWSNKTSILARLKIKHDGMSFKEVLNMSLNHSSGRLLNMVKDCFQVKVLAKHLGDPCNTLRTKSRHQEHGHDKQYTNIIKNIEIHTTTYKFNKYYTHLYPVTLVPFLLLFWMWNLVSWVFQCMGPRRLHPGERWKRPANRWSYKQK